ncbi:MAG: DUF3577 domain-containing protein [Zoogloeaceae bacterium]|jgi:hypothetical protein|nr:DUF3577 domain-containing protein [Zoogloeaceae bacterium]
MTATPSSQEKSYFDLHLTGSGRIRRIRDVAPDHGPSYLACDIVASRKGRDESVRFDCNVVGKDAQPLVRRCDEAIKAGQDVRVGFKLGDLRSGTFTYAEGERAGERGISLKTRLLFIRWITVDGALIHEAPTKAPGEERPRHIPGATASDLSITGLGYLNRIHWVKSENGFFLACGIGALNGRRDKPSTVYFEARVFAKETQDRVLSYKEAVDDKKKVLIGFDLDGLSAGFYTPKQGKNAGKQMVALKTELARLRWVKVDGVLAYKAETPEKSEPKSEEEIPTEIPETEPAEALAA